MLSSLLKKRVSVVTVDGRYLVGVLHTADQLMNLVLTACVERVAAPYDATDAEAEATTVQEQSLGVLMLRGSDVVHVAAIDVYEEANVDVKTLAGRDMPPVMTVPRSAMDATVA